MLIEHVKYQSLISNEDVFLISTYHFITNFGSHGNNCLLEGVNIWNEWNQRTGRGDHGVQGGGGGGEQWVGRCITLFHL